MYILLDFVLITFYAMYEFGALLGGRERESEDRFYFYFFPLRWCLWKSVNDVVSDLSISTSPEHHTLGGEKIDLKYKALSRQCTKKKKKMRS